MLTFAQLYHPPDVLDAYETFGANCGPAALAAVLRQPVNALRPVLDAGGFTGRGYMNPTHLRHALRASGYPHVKGYSHAQGFPLGGCPYGLQFLQWTGPWTEPHASPRWAYRYTHTVGVAFVNDGSRYGDIYYYDINASSEVSEHGAWVPLEWWMSEIAPLITNTIPRADGGYFVRWLCPVPPQPPAGATQEDAA